MRKRKAKKKSESPVRDLDSEIAKVKSELDDAILYEKINQACFEDNRTDETFFSICGSLYRKSKTSREIRQST